MIAAGIERIEAETRCWIKFKSERIDSRVRKRCHPTQTQGQILFWPYNIWENLQTEYDWFGTYLFKQGYWKEKVWFWKRCERLHQRL